MAYTLLSLKDLTELKTRRGTSSNTASASILGYTYPSTEGYTTFVWDDSSLLIADDIEVIQPSVGPSNGRWLRVSLNNDSQIPSDWSSSINPSQILNKPSTISGFGITDAYTKAISDNRYLQSETDPTVPSYVKGITSSEVSNWNTSYSWGNHSLVGYITPGSISTLTNKSGNISQWSNNLGYITGITSGDIISSLGYTPYSTLNPSSYISSVTSSMVTTALGYTPLTTSRVLTINGVGWDLTTNRSWTVGDITSSSSYVNPTWITSLAYTKLTGTPTIPSNTSQISESSNLYYTDTRSRLALSAGTGISYNNSTGIITNSSPDQVVSLTPGSNISVSGTYPNFTVGSTATGPTFSTPTRALNTNYTISTTKNARVNYTIRVAYNITILVGSTGVATLQYSIDSGSTWTSVVSTSNSINLGLALTGYNDLNLSGEVPANSLVRINTTGTTNATMTIRSEQQEVLY